MDINFDFGDNGNLYFNNNVQLINTYYKIENSYISNNGVANFDEYKKLINIYHEIEKKLNDYLIEIENNYNMNTFIIKKLKYENYKEINDTYYFDNVETLNNTKKIINNYHKKMNQLNDQLNEIEYDYENTRININKLQYKNYKKFIIRTQKMNNIRINLYRKKIMKNDTELIKNNQIYRPGQKYSNKK